MARRNDTTRAPEWDDFGSVMTVDQVAALMQVETQTVYSWIKKGTLPAVRVPGSRAYRVQKTTLMGWINDNEQPVAKDATERGTKTG